MKSTNCLQPFLKYTSLNVLGMLGLSCYILADTFFVSMGLGANGLAALNLAIPFYSFIHGIGLMIGMGGGTKYSIAKSQSDQPSTNHAFTHAMGIACIFAILITLIGIFFSEDIVHLMGANKDVFQMSKTYLQTILLFSSMFILNNVLLCFVRNDGAPQRSMLAMIIGSLSNIILDYVFIFPCNMGIFGAALATGIAPIVSMLILAPYFVKKKHQFHIVKCTIAKRLTIAILSSGFPSLITEVSSGIVMIVFNMIILNLQGNVGVAAYGIIANLSLVTMSIYTGIAQGIQPLISSYYGAKNKAHVQKIFHYACSSILVISILLYGGIYFGSDTLVSIFNSEHNVQLHDIAINGLRIYFTSCLFAGFNIILSIYFTSTQDARPAHLLSLLRGFFIIIPMTLFLSNIAGINGVWCSLSVTEIIVSSIGCYVYYRKKTKAIKLP